MSVEQLHARLLAVASQLDEAAAEIRDIPLLPERENVQHIGSALAEIFEVMRAIHAVKPDLVPAQLQETEPGRQANFQLSGVLSEVSRLVGEERLLDALELLKGYAESGAPELHRTIARDEIRRITQADRINRLSENDLTLIDSALLFHASSQRRKVARVVASAINDLQYHDVPDAFFAERVAHLVAVGKLEAFGDVRRIRYSEVKLPDTGSATASA